MKINDWKDRITVNPDVLVGKPIIKGTRLSVEFILNLLAEGWDEKTVLENYPQLKMDDLLAVFSYASERLREEDYRIFKRA